MPVESEHAIDPNFRDVIIWKHTSETIKKSHDCITEEAVKDHLHVQDPFMSGTP